MSTQIRFHISFSGQRTTISVDRLLFELMALRLKVPPDDEYAHSTVKEWLQDTMISKLGDQPGRKNASQWARRYLIEAIADKRLYNRWEDWRSGGA